jgi:hypothetical protein
MDGLEGELPTICLQKLRGICKRKLVLQTETGYHANTSLEHYTYIKFLVVLILELSKTTKYDME